MPTSSAPRVGAHLADAEEPLDIAPGEELPLEPLELAGCAAGSPAGQAVPGRLEASVSPAAAGEAAATFDGLDVGGAARAGEGRGELVDVGRRSGRRPSLVPVPQPTRAYSVALRRLDA